MKISYKALGNAFTLMVLLLSTGAFLPLVVDPASLETSAEGSPLTKVLWAAIYLIVALRVTSRYRQIAPLVRANKCLCLLVLLAIVSTLWSQDPAITLHHGVALLGTTLVAIDFALHYSIREQLRLICIVLGLVVLLSIAVETFAPGLIPRAPSDLDQVGWQGIFATKNNFGRIVVLAAAAFLSRPRRRRRGTLLMVTVMVIAGAVICAAHSAGSLITLGAIVLMYSAFGALRWRPAVLTIAGVGALLIVIPTANWALNNLDAVTAILGRDPTLSGRTELWRLTVENIAQSPVLGHGYDAFWNVSSQQATRIRGAIGWPAPTSHDGYLDLLLDLGFAGLLLYASSYVIAVRRAVTIFRGDPAHEIVWPLNFMSFALLCQVVEAGIFGPNSIFWILYAATAFSVSKPLIVTEGAVQDREPAESISDAVLTEV
jgi:exopolysaccharide production protein ExoQ